jgi:hypothetical protein
MSTRRPSASLAVGSASTAARFAVIARRASRIPGGTRRRLPKFRGGSGVNPRRMVNRSSRTRHVRCSKRLRGGHYEHRQMGSIS